MPYNLPNFLGPAIGRALWWLTQGYTFAETEAKLRQKFAYGQFTEANYIQIMDQAQRNYSATARAEVGRYARTLASAFGAGVLGSDTIGIRFDPVSSRDDPRSDFGTITVNVRADANLAEIKARVLAALAEQQIDLRGRDTLFTGADDVELLTLVEGGFDSPVLDYR